MSTENKQVEDVNELEVEVGQKHEEDKFAQSIEFISEVSKDTKVEFEAYEISQGSVEIKVKVSSLSGGKLGPVKVAINIPDHDQKKNIRYCCQPKLYSLANNFNYPKIEEDDSNKEAVFQANAFYSKLWKNGTTLNYYFLETPNERDRNGQKKHVIAAFQTWKNLGIGLNFVETKIQKNAQIVIGFNLSPSQGSYSYVGTDCQSVLKQDPNAKTMNFGWLNIHQDGTALHEIGHALGFSHEHQNPACAIVWNVPALLKSIPEWDEEQIRSNIIDKLPANIAKYSPWDKTSIMQYPVDGYTVISPADVKNKGVPRNTKLSPTDIEWIRKMYPIVK